jgi:hypothetical protein
MQLTNHLSELEHPEAPMLDARMINGTSSEKVKILILSLYYSTDRVLLYTDLLRDLSASAAPTVWSFAVREDNFPSDNPNAEAFEEYKGVSSIPEWLNWVRRFNDYLWDAKGLSYSRQSIWRLIKSEESDWKHRFLRRVASVANKLIPNVNIDRVVFRLIQQYGYCRESLRRFEESRLSAVISMVPFAPLQMSTVAAARKLGIPVIAYITSWDNLTTKTRLMADYDGYIVWSEAMKNELLEFHPHANGKPVHVVGAPQYDVLTNSKYFVSRESFLASQGLTSDRKTVVYCLGSPNFIKEDFGTLEFLEEIGEDLRNDLQVIVRLHPGFYEKDYKIIPQISERFENVVVQGNEKYFDRIPVQPETSIIEWVNTFRHADVVINLASTVTVDACIFDRPVININYDAEPGSPNHQLVTEINERWNHFSPIAKSGGVWNVDSTAELLVALRGYLDNPELHGEGRQRIVEHVCGRVDGRAGSRMAMALSDMFSGQAAQLSAGDRFRRASSTADGHAT